VPFTAAVLVAIAPRKWKFVKEIFALFATASMLIVAAELFGRNATLTAPWAGFGFEFSLRCYSFSSFIILAIAFFGFLVTLFSSVWLGGKPYAKQFYAYLLVTLSFASGAVLSDNLAVLLFFWEGLLVTLFAMIAIGNPASFKTATKAFIIVGASDLCFMIGIALAARISGTFAISGMNIALTGAGGLAFLLLMTGAIAKSGSMPFHTWIPDAATDAPLPFMAIVPAALEKLVGIYMLARISLDMFKSVPGSWASTVMMIVGAVTIVLAVSMALIQKDYKRLLSYHAISQVGYMILGVGTLIPAGIIGGLFHMINNALYKSCLFLTGGAVEKQAGTTDLRFLGGLWRKMPVTFACFTITALSISGVPPFNGFFSKELVYDGALERHWIFYVAAVLGSFLTAASFLKLGHAAYVDKPRGDIKNVKDPGVPMLIPMIVIAAACIAFGLGNSFVLGKLIQPCVSARWLEGADFAHFHANTALVAITVAVLIAALLNHLYGMKRSGSGLGASEHIHHAPILSGIYNRAEKRFFDPYEWGLKAVNAVSRITWAADRMIDFVYNVLTPRAAYMLSGAARRFQNGDYSRYILWSVAGAILITIFVIRGGM
jgi:NADH-quinone oxidoreductase subunit L